MLVNAFVDVGRYSKPLTSILPDTNSTLQEIGQWKYVLKSDFTIVSY